MFIRLRKIKSCWQGILTLHEKKKEIFNINIGASENVCLFVSLLWLVSFGVCIYIQYFFDVMRNTPNNKYLLELIKRRSKIQERNMSCELVLNFDLWKTFSENYKPMRVWLWLVYKLTENNCCSRLFSEFTQTQKRYPTSLDKASILTLKLLVIWSQNFSCELNSFQNISYLSLRL